LTPALAVGNVIIRFTVTSATLFPELGPVLDVNVIACVVVE
jgi:hypothetical protein